MKITTGLVTVLVVAFVGLVGGITVIMLTGHDVALYVTNIGILLTAVAGFIVTLRTQQKTQEDITTVKTNTNGTLSTALAQIASLQTKLNAALALLPANHAEDVLANTITKDQVPTPTAVAAAAPAAPVIAESPILGAVPPTAD